MSIETTSKVLKRQFVAHAHRRQFCARLAAIDDEDDLSDQRADYFMANVEFFDEIGSPSGPAKVGVIPGDHPIVTTVPPQNQ